MRIIKSFEICQKLNFTTIAWPAFWQMTQEARRSMNSRVASRRCQLCDPPPSFPFSLQHIKAINNVTIWTCVWYSVGFFDRHFWPTGCGHTLVGRSQLMRKFEVSVGGVILYTHILASPRRVVETVWRKTISLNDARAHVCLVVILSELTRINLHLHDELLRVRFRP